MKKVNSMHLKCTGESTVKPTYLEMAKRHTQSKGPGGKFQLPRTSPPVQRLVNPDHTIVVDQVENPTKYANTLELKKGQRQKRWWDHHILQKRSSNQKKSQPGRSSS